MAALTAARATDSRNLGPKSVKKVAGSTTIFQGGLVMTKSDGYAAPAGASASNKGCPGVALETVVNSGADGAATVAVQEGEFLFAGDTLAQASVDGVVYADDDQTVDETQATNCPVAGILTEVVSASQGWVRVGLAYKG
jgi:hypothetical protein